MLSHDMKAKFQICSFYLRTTVKVIALLLFASYGATLPGKYCKGLGSKSKDMPLGQVHTSTIEAVASGGSFYWMRVGCTESTKTSPYCKLQELTHIYVTGIVYNLYRILTHFVPQRKEHS